MKKTILVTALALALAPLTQSFAASEAETLANGVGAQIGFNASTNVELLYGNQDDGTTAQSYVVMAKHTAGNKIIASTSMSNLMTSPQNDECKGEDVDTCLGLVGLTALNANSNGEDNVDALTAAGWTEL